MLLLSCNNYQAAIEASFSKKKSLICQMEQLKQQNDSLWEDISLTLEQELPSDMMPDERKNMVQIKNAGLISMFQVFPDLDTAIQRKVMLAGKKDEEMAAEMKSIMQKLSLAEQNLNTALEKLEHKNKGKLQQVKLQLLEREGLPCH